MTFRRFRALPPLLASAAMLASCAASGPFPSLAPRAVEHDPADSATPIAPCLKESQEAPGRPARPAQPPVTAVEQADPSLPARLDALKAKAGEGDSAFIKAIGAAAAAASIAGAAGSESWVAAQQAVSRAETARAPTLDALSDLSALAVAVAQRRANPADAQALREALGAVQAIADRQSARIGEVRAPLKNP